MARLGGLVVSSGDRRNRGEYTGPPHWDLHPNISLKEAEIDILALYNVSFLNTVDLTGSVIRSIENDNATFSQVVGEWPVETAFYWCFISYSTRDQAFVENLHARLEENGVRLRRSPEIDHRCSNRVDSKTNSPGSS